MPRPDLDLIRQRYGYSCGYCGVSEVAAGGILTVDHYHPLAAGGDDSLDNLVYACVRCNQYKHDYWPASEEQARGFKVLHPLQDVLAEHYRLNPQTGQLEPLTETGRFHITLLRLNRPQLVKHRLAHELRGLFRPMQAASRPIPSPARLAVRLIPSGPSFQQAAAWDGLLPPDRRLIWRMFGRMWWSHLSERLCSVLAR
jgi:hypothetical protein